MFHTTTNELENFLRNFGFRFEADDQGREAPRCLPRPRPGSVQAEHPCAWEGRRGA